MGFRLEFPFRQKNVNETVTAKVQTARGMAQVQKSKEAKMKAAMAGGKSRKKKWAKGKAPGRE